MDDQKHQSLIKKLVSNARAIISEQIGLSVGVKKMCNILLWLAPYENVKIEGINIFEKYDNEAKYIPSGTARLHCSKEAFERYDAQLEAINRRFRRDIFQACFKIIERYGDRNRLEI